MCVDHTDHDQVVAYSMEYGALSIIAWIADMLDLKCVKFNAKCGFTNNHQATYIAYTLGTQCLTINSLYMSIFQYPG